MKITDNELTLMSFFNHVKDIESIVFTVSDHLEK